MKRKSIVYRRLWYAGKRNSAGIHVVIRLLALILVLVFSYTFFQCFIFPGLKESVETRIRQEYVSALGRSAGKVFSYGPEYRKIVLFNSASNGGISAVSLDSSALEAFTDELLGMADRELGLPGSWRIVVPVIGSDGVFSGREGILNLEVAVYQDARTVVGYHCEFLPVNGGQTKMVVSMTAEADIRYRGRLLEGNVKVVDVMPVGEYIIFGKFPED